MFWFSRRNIFFLNFTIGVLLVTFITLRLHNTGIIDLRLRKPTVKLTTRNIKATTPTNKTPLRIPWRFHIEEDGFVFPPTDNKERFITYERLNGSWTKQLLQFENANVFAYLLKRTLLVPPLFPYKSSMVNNLTDKSKDNNFYMSEVIDFDLLSSMIKLGEIDTTQVDNIKLMKRYTVCHDPRLGFWLDYIPSVENIQTWRLLKEQYFSPLKLNLNGLERQYICPGTENYIDRWGPPLHVKALYRGILTELYKRNEDLIYFQGDTLDTTHIRFFDKQRAQKAQELLLFYIRFSKKITKTTKRLARLLDYGYIAVLANHVVGSKDDGSISTFIANEAERHSLKNASRNVLIVSKSNQHHLFTNLQQRGFNLVFAETFIENNLPKRARAFLRDKIHLLSLLLCAYATKFIGLPGTSDLYFVEHLRLQDTTLIDGLVTDKVSVRWAKHTTRDKADERKVLLRTTKPPAPEKRMVHELSAAQRAQKIAQMKQKVTFRKPVKKLDRLNNIACIFCNYIRYVTGLHGCPNMKHIC